MSYLMLFHDSSGYANAPQCYVYAYYTLPVLLNVSKYRECTRVAALSRRIVQVCTAVDPMFALRWRLWNQSNCREIIRVTRCHQRTLLSLRSLLRYHACAVTKWGQCHFIAGLTRINDRLQQLLLLAQRVVSWRRLVKLNKLWESDPA